MLWSEVRFNLGSGAESFRLRRAGSGGHTYVDRFGGDHRCRTQNSADHIVLEAIELVPTVICLRAGTGANNSDISFSKNGGPVTTHPLTHTASYEPTDLAWLSDYDTNLTNCIRGSGSLLVIYKGKLDNADAQDAIALANYWVANNEAPPVGNPPNTTFGPLDTDDNASVSTWTWQESSNNTDWNTVGTILSDVSGVNTQTLTVNSAPSSANGTYVKLKAETGTGVIAYSNAAQLFVQ